MLKVARFWKNFSNFGCFLLEVCSNSSRAKLFASFWEISWARQVSSFYPFLPSAVPPFWLFLRVAGGLLELFSKRWRSVHLIESAVCQFWLVLKTRPKEGPKIPASRSGGPSDIKKHPMCSRFDCFWRQVQIKANYFSLFSKRWHSGPCQKDNIWAASAVSPLRLFQALNDATIGQHYSMVLFLQHVR
jgi:hypothetical protein